ncbi:hypothetical protein CGMCC3_g7615 [Colletotrichum fructicola]|nr:uncharacterized protein CGMCC3_g7615 [Colletotrichum fructicola]KAE9576625.1 hypothetical protein CGMCC3_g7615 [Colletotrichum fructicola]
MPRSRMVCWRSGRIWSDRYDNGTCKKHVIDEIQRCLQQTSYPPTLTRSEIHNEGSCSEPVRAFALRYCSELYLQNLLLTLLTIGLKITKLSALKLLFLWRWYFTRLTTAQDLDTHESNTHKKIHDQRTMNWTFN